jgi:hypothetical protein
VYAAHDIFERAGMPVLIWLLAVSMVVDFAQLTASSILLKRVAERAPALERIESIIEMRWGTGARVCSNNEHYTKMLMQHDWKYVYCFAVGQPYCGMPIAQAFSRFPVLRREACERIVEQFRINACLLDREAYDALFENVPSALTSMSVAYETDRFRLLFLEWDSGDDRLEPA